MASSTNEHGTTEYESTAATTAPSVGIGSTNELQPDFAFTDAETLFSKIAETEGDGLVVNKISPQQFAEVCRQREARGRKIRFFFLAGHTKQKDSLLLVTVPTWPHECLHLGLYTRLAIDIAAMGLLHSWTPAGAVTCMSPNNASSGEGDSGGMPRGVWGELGAPWPTIMFQSGHTQSLQSLRVKMRWWFAESNHSVKIVVLGKAFPGGAGTADGTADGGILVEHWQERPAQAPPRPGATTTRQSAAASLLPECLQTINVVWADQSTPFNEATRPRLMDPELYSVTRGPLRLDFQQLFLRQPAAPLECDVVISNQELQYIAANVWSRR